MHTHTPGPHAEGSRSLCIKVEKWHISFCELFLGFYFVCTSFARVYGCTTDAHPQKSEESFGSLGSEFKDGCEPPHGDWELKLGPLQEQQVCLSTESSLQPQVASFHSHTSKYQAPWGPSSQNSDGQPHTKPLQPLRISDILLTANETSISRGALGSRWKSRLSPPKPLS